MGLRAAIVAGMKQLEEVLAKDASEATIKEARPLLNRVLLSAESEGVDDATKQLVKENKDALLASFKKMQSEVPAAPKAAKAASIIPEVEQEAVVEADVPLTQAQIDNYRKKYDIPVDAKGNPIKEKGSMNRTWEEKRKFYANTAKPYDLSEGLLSVEDIQKQVKAGKITAEEAKQLIAELGSK